MRFLPVCAILLTFGAIQAFGGAAEGKAVFDSKCKTCHGADGAGNPQIAKMMKVEMKPLSSAEVQGKSDADLKKDITEGTGKMKPIAGLSAPQVTDVIAYVRTLKK